MGGGWISFLSIYVMYAGIQCNLNTVSTTCAVRRRITRSSQSRVSIHFLLHVIKRESNKVEVGKAELGR